MKAAPGLSAGCFHPRSADLIEVCTRPISFFVNVTFIKVNIRCVWFWVDSVGLYCVYAFE